MVDHPAMMQRRNFNVGAYWKRKYKGKQQKEPWFILTNLDSLSEVLKVYRARAGIEAMFKDCKTGGYCLGARSLAPYEGAGSHRNLEGSKANNKRLTSLILLIAIAYTATSLTRLCVFARLKNLKSEPKPNLFPINIKSPLFPLKVADKCQ